MSAHHFPGTFGNHQVNFCVGWDRKNKSYFFEVISLEEVVLYRSEISTTLKHKQGRLESMFDLTEELQRMEITLPDRVLVEVAEDRLNNVGNRFVFYNDRGFITTDTVCSDGWERTVPGALATVEAADNKRVAKQLRP